MIVTHKNVKCDSCGGSFWGRLSTAMQVGWRWVGKRFLCPGCQDAYDLERQREEHDRGE